MSAVPSSIRTTLKIRRAADGRDQSIPGSVETQRPSDPPDGRRSVFSDRPDFPVGGTSAAAAHYGSELDRKSREWVGNLNRYAALLLLLVPWLISGADQTNRFPPVLPQASFGCDVAHRGWRGREAHLVRAAIRHV